MTDKGKLKAKLIIFLEANGALEKFMANIESFTDIDSLCESEIGNEDEWMVFASAFSWRGTAEGSEYWLRLYELFCSSYDNLPTERTLTDYQWDDMWAN